ncbi:MAG: 50S ribosomal protein L17 [Candidatus Marinimicrobia bacterium CG08_land_8_20_14_0_20_45_22]|nr:MAG: 50S ribosomal protein L17 [Candidatus Marinimicrobia bacterium CG08_land_8_20_14_0_20_45_22]
MRHQKRVAKLGMVASHQKAMLSNMAGSLIQHGKIKTTDARAKELRRVVERLITFGKKGTIHHRRLAYKVLNDRTLVKLLFDHIAPQYATRNGGYTRIVKLGFRDNDAAAVSLIEFVDYKKPAEEKKPAKPSKKESAKREKRVTTEVKEITEIPAPAPKAEKQGE